MAELVLAEIILLMRGIPQRNAPRIAADGSRPPTGSREVRGKTLGIVGYGHIGTQIGVLAESLGMQVVYYDIETKLALGNARPIATLDELLEISDVVTLHVPETPQTQNMIGAAQLARMKQGAKLINASRGTVVDIDALADALQSEAPRRRGHRRVPDRTQRRRRRIRLAAARHGQRDPHAAHRRQHRGSAAEYRHRGCRQADQVQQQRLDADRREFPRSLAAGASRASIACCTSIAISPACCRPSTRFSPKQQINIAGQYLQTNAQIGYVVIDVETETREASLDVKRALEKVPGTIRTRILY